MRRFSFFGDVLMLFVTASFLIGWRLLACAKFLWSISRKSTNTSAPPTPTPAHTVFYSRAHACVPLRDHRSIALVPCFALRCTFSSAGRFLLSNPIYLCKMSRGWHRQTTAISLAVSVSRMHRDWSSRGSLIMGHTRHLHDARSVHWWAITAHSWQLTPCGDRCCKMIFCFTK